MTDTEILLVEDEEITAMDLQELIEQAQYSVQTVVDTAESALDHLQENPVDLVIMDIRLNGEMDGVEAVEVINQNHQVPVVYLTAHSDDKTLDRAKETEPAGFLVKPVTQVDLKSTIEMVLDK